MSISARTSLRDHHPHHYNHPSFSSSLLEEIYRSFDHENHDNHHHPHCTDHYRMKKSSSTYLDRDTHFNVDQWMRNENVNVNVNPRRISQSEAKSRRNGRSFPVKCSTSTSSSDSSSGVFTSSDTDSLYGYSSKQRQKPLTAPPLKPIRTAVNQPDSRRKIHGDDFPAAKNKKEGNLQRRALKLYGDLKKVKQPISPGGKLASFLNSLFNAGASKKQKLSSSSSCSSQLPSLLNVKLQRETMTTTSTPSTASRSCLSKTPSSTGRFERRSVRFVDDVNCDNSLASDEGFKHQIREKHRRVEGVAKELLKNYHNRKELTVNNISTNHGRKFENLPKFNDDEDDVSCCSSDLFELENLVDDGVANRYREELPVYETTHVGTNRAIAKGFIL